jgi:hypothetical protein
MCNGDDAFYEQLNKFSPGGVFDRHAFRHAVVNGQFPDRSHYPAHIPLKLRNVIRKAMNTDPAQRHQSALEVSNDMSEVSGNHLDWRLELEPDARVWKKNIEGTDFEFRVTAASVSTLLRRSPGGNWRRINDGCQNGVSRTDVKRNLGEY